MTDQPKPAATEATDLRQRIAEALAREDVNWGYDHGFGLDPKGSLDDPETAAFVDAVHAAIRPELDRLAAAESDLAELTQARQHGAYTYCEQLVGHVTVAAFAQKISEKRNALGQREEVVQYANEQKQRAEQAEAALDRVRKTLDSFNGRGVITVDRGNLDIPRASEVIEAVRAALDQPAPPHDAGPSVRQCAVDDRVYWERKDAGEGQ